MTGFAIVGLSLSALAVLLYGLLRGAWLQGLLGGIALGMSMLPEEFPLVLTVFMVMGAWRLSRSQVLTRRPAAIETLGAATVLCTDKTGTLTRNLMSVEWLERDAQCAAAVARPAGSRALHPRLQELLETAVLASRPEAVDPMDRALVRLAADVGGGAAGAELVRGYPWLPELPALVQVWRLPSGSRWPPPRARRRRLPRFVASMPPPCRRCVPGWRSWRAAGCGCSPPLRHSSQSAAPPESALDLPLELVGLIGFVDPLRAGIPEAVRECRSAGIRVVMITGDHPETARAIAAQAGIEHDEVMTGPELARLDERSLLERAPEVSVFARITPQQKLRIVTALKARGEVVAMTGDGVNDAPALRSAHIGIAMGQRGTDVAREASSLVLLDDDFNSIVRAVRLGRRIYDNLVKAVSYILAIHLPIAGLALVPIALGRPLVLTPMLIAILELIIDPLCSVVLEAERDERDVMARPPRDPEERAAVASAAGDGLPAGGAGNPGGMRRIPLRDAPRPARRDGALDGLPHPGVRQLRPDLRQPQLQRLAARGLGAPESFPLGQRDGGGGRAGRDLPHPGPGRVPAPGSVAGRPGAPLHCGRGGAARGSRRR